MRNALVDDAKDNSYMRLLGRLGHPLKLSEQATPSQQKSVTDSENQRRLVFLFGFVLRNSIRNLEVFPCLGIITGLLGLK